MTALSSSIEATHPLRVSAVPHALCAAGQHWVWDGVSFTVLHPPVGDDLRTGPKPKTPSCVLRVADAHGQSLLLTGDIEAEQEQRLVTLAKDDAVVLASGVLVVPHHGSKTSSSASFLDAVQPQVAVMQAGRLPQPLRPSGADGGGGATRSAGSRCSVWTAAVPGPGTRGSPNLQPTANASGVPDTGTIGWAAMAQNLRTADRPTLSPGDLPCPSMLR